VRVRVDVQRARTGRSRARLLPPLVWTGMLFDRGGVAAAVKAGAQLKHARRWRSCLGRRGRPLTPEHGSMDWCRSPVRRGMRVGSGVRCRNEGKCVWVGAVGKAMQFIAVYSPLFWPLPAP